MIKICLLLIILINFIFADDVSLSKDEANSLGRQALGKYGSKSGASENLSKPLQTGTQLKTLDDSQSFDGKVTSGCGVENDKGIQLSFSTAGDNLLTVSINQDTDANSSYDYSYSISNITSICSGGIGKNDGKYYKYVFNPINRKISIAEYAKSEMGSCFCILNSCNYGGYSQSIADKITGDLIGTIGGSGVANYQVGITQYDVASKSYELYVKNNTTCNDSNMGNNYTNINPQNYYSSQTTPPVSIADVMIKDNSDSQSLYYTTKEQNNVVINSSGSSHNINSTNLKSCTIKKIPFINSSGNIEIEVQNSCEEFSSCILQREEVCDGSDRNCIDMVLNGSLTGKTYPIKCIDFDETKQVCANGNTIYSASKINGGTINLYTASGSSYFYTKKEFNCGTTTENYDASKSDTTLGSVNKSGSTLNYTSFDGSSQNINLGDYDNCVVRYCSYKKVGNSTQIYTDGTSNVSTKDGTSTNEYQYKQCNQLAGGSFTCPLENEETMIENCSCNLGMFGAGLAIGYASAIEDAVKDFTCSTN